MILLKGRPYVYYEYVITGWKMNLLVLFVVSAVTLGLEILLTRVFSVVLFASHSFLAISLALLGTGSGALLVYLAKPLDKDKLQRRQILLLALLSLTIIVSLWGLLQIEFVPQKIEDPNDPGGTGQPLVPGAGDDAGEEPGAFQDPGNCTGQSPLPSFPFSWPGIFRHSSSGVHRRSSA